MLPVIHSPHPFALPCDILTILWWCWGSSGKERRPTQLTDWLSHWLVEMNFLARQGERSVCPSPSWDLLAVKSPGFLFNTTIKKQLQKQNWIFTVHRESKPYIFLLWDSFKHLMLSWLYSCLMGERGGGFLPVSMYVVTPGNVGVTPCSVCLLQCQSGYLQTSPNGLCPSPRVIPSLCGPSGWHVCSQQHLERERGVAAVRRAFIDIDSSSLSYGHRIWLIESPTPLCRNGTHT